MDILHQIIQILVSGLVDFGTGLGNGIQSIVQALFVNVDSGTGAQTLTLFGIIICVFAGLSLAVSLSRKLFNWIATLGGSK